MDARKVELNKPTLSFNDCLTSINGRSTIYRMKTHLVEHLDLGFH